MNCFCSVWNGFINSFLFDGKWWKDYGIPFIIPLLVWHLTRFYGADKAEERKELKELRDNLNLLLNLVGINIVGLLSINRYTTKMLLQINNDILDAVKLEKDGFFNALFFNDLLKNIDITKYSQ